MIKKSVLLNISENGKLEVSPGILKLEISQVLKKFKSGQVDGQIFFEDGIKILLNVNSSTKSSKQILPQRYSLKPYIKINLSKGLISGVESAFLFKNKVQISVSVENSKLAGFDSSDSNTSKIECKIPISDSSSVNFGIETITEMSEAGCIGFIVGIQKSSFGFSMPLRVPLSPKVLACGTALFGVVTLGLKKLNKILAAEEDENSLIELEEGKTRAAEQQFLMKHSYEKSVKFNETSGTGLIILEAIIKGVEKTKDFGSGDSKKNKSGASIEEEEDEDVFITEKDSGNWMEENDRGFLTQSMDCTIPVQLRVTEGCLVMSLWNLKNEPGFYDPTNDDKNKNLILMITYKRKSSKNWITETKTFDCSQIDSKVHIKPLTKK